MREERTFCRICTGHCGLLLAIDEDGAPVSVRGDREDPRSLGYICSKMVDALRNLDLLISIEPVLSATARLSHYILPPKLQFERPDLPIYLFEPNIFPTPYTRYTPPLVDPLAGSDVCDEWKVFWEIARRTGRSTAYMGTALDMDESVEEKHLIALTLANAPVSLDEVKRHPLGYYHANLQYAVPADPATAGRFATMPQDVATEMEALVREDFPFHFINRRARHRMNSMGATLPDLIRAMPHNPVHMCPEDMARLDIISTDRVEIASTHGVVTGQAQAGGTLRPSVVSMLHGFGGLPDEDVDDAGSPNLLISTDSDLQAINAMPRMTAIPVRVRRLNPLFPLSVNQRIRQHDDRPYRRGDAR